MNKNGQTTLHTSLSQKQPQGAATLFLQFTNHRFTSPSLTNASHYRHSTQRRHFTLQHDVSYFSLHHDATSITSSATIAFHQLCGWYNAGLYRIFIPKSGVFGNPDLRVIN
ncbi:hypothetical protein RND81_04G190300 [Saponaria officinalis]|uniref:Uncharacterized protein n=1 Tax=Saponaria officinalis TaxID=3572 RepID=A0AAW1LNS0_SAPOF